MSMTSNARKAFEQLLARRVAVKAWGEKDGYGEHTQFVLIPAMPDHDQCFPIYLSCVRFFRLTS